MTKQKIKRIRGLILSRPGWQKLQDAKTEWEFATNQGNKITLEEIAERAGLTTATIRKILTRNEGVDRRSIVILFSALNLELTAEDCTKPTLQEQSGLIDRKIDWGEAVDVSVFYGRTRELETLARWIVEDRCRLISVIGIGGIGKTTLSIKITQQVESQFECLIWRSLRDAPPIQEFLINLIQFLSEQPVVGKDIPESVRDKITLFINCLRSSRCLVVFDNIESLMCDENRAGICADEYQEYSQLFQRLAASEHQSCVLLTTREKPQEVIPLEGETSPVRSLQLDGLKEQEGEAILQQKGLEGSAAELANLVERYNGNPLALKIVGTTIRDLFESNVADFLRQDMAIFGDINDLLTQQFQRLLDIEDRIMYWLAINREPITLEQLQTDLVDSLTQLKLIDGLESLVRRCLIEKAEYSAGDDGVRFTLQSVVMEYVTNKLIQEICQEINTQELELFRFYALVKATAKDYIKETQKRLIFQPLIVRLLDIFGCQGNIEQRLLQLKSTLQETSPGQTGYIAGNILNLLCYLRTDLTGADFSNLCIWQADLQNVCLHNVSFQNSNLAKSVFCETFGGVLSIAFSPDGEFLAAGDSNGNIYLWRVESSQQVLIFRGHTNWVVSLAFSPDGQTLCSGSADATVRLWNVETGVYKKTLREHQDEVWSVVFSPDGELLASGSDDNTIRIWNVSTNKCLKIFTEHTSWVTSLAFSPNGEMLASGSDDNTIRIWNVSTSECIKTLEGHSGGVRTIAIKADNQLLASGSEDHTIKLWNLTTGECLKTLTGHTNRVFSLAFSPKEDYIATSCHNYEIKLWNLTTGECLKTFKEHSSWIFSIAFSPKEGYLASSSHDQTVKLWNIDTGQVWKKFQGYSNQVLSVAYSSDGQRLASGSYDSKIRLWNINTGQILKEFQGHTNGVYSIAFSPQGNFLASGSGDKTVMLWEIGENKILRTLKGHSGSVRSIAFHPDGQIIASGSEDQTVRLWNFYTGQLINVFQEHQADVWSVAFSLNGKTLASGSWDHSIKLWDINTNKCCRTLNGHTNWIWSIAFSPDSQTLASCSPDRTLKLWNVHTGECLKTLQVSSSSGWLLSIAFSPDGKTLAGSCQDGTITLWSLDTYECIKILSGHNAGWIWSIVFGNDSQVLVSGSEDETIKLWNVRTGDCLKTMKAKSLYQDLNLKRASSLTEAAKLGLKNLGAVD
jgi:WD40 repeat protein/transcriptional regulator with XRE-family HTH domain